jgi:hypothetical protein
MPELPDDARCRILIADPDFGELAPLIAGLGKLFTQFAREQRLVAWDVYGAHDGAALVLAWSPDAPLSGCSHDKLNGVVALHEARTGCRILAAPPLCIRVDGGWRCVDRAGLRAVADPSTPLIDHRIERLGHWRQRGLTTVGASWAAALLAPRQEVRA